MFRRSPTVQSTHEAMIEAFKMMEDEANNVRNTPKDREVFQSLATKFQAKAAEIGGDTEA